MGDLVTFGNKNNQIIKAGNLSIESEKENRAMKLATLAVMLRTRRVQKENEMGYGKKQKTENNSKREQEYEDEEER